MALRVVTDSACDLPPEVARSLNVTVVPCNVHFGEAVYRDGVDLQPGEFYRKLAAGPGSLPKTSQPSAAAFLEVYERLAGEADEILSLHLSSKLSGTCQSALMAKGELQRPVRLEVFDSLQVSLGLGILVVEAARIGERGGSLAEVLEFLRQERSHVVSYCTVDTLEYLVRGGRASRLQGFLGSALDIKPIIAVRDGETHPVDRVRSRRRAMSRLLEIATSAPRLRALGVLHSACPQDAEALAEGCSGVFPRQEMIISEFSAVMGAHLGPRALGLVLWTGT